MEWSRKKDQFFNLLGTRLRSLSSNRSKKRHSYLTYDSRIRIPIIINTINVTQASIQTIPIDWNNNAEESRKSRRRKYQHRFNKCLAELVEKYPPIPAYDYLQKDEDQINASIWSKLFQSREDLAKLNQTLEDLDKRLEDLSLNICSKCGDTDHLY